MEFEKLNFIISTLTLIAHITFVGAVLLFLFNKKSRVVKKGFELLNTHGLLLAFGIAAFASVTSLVYSEVVHLPPCALCWYQRIFMFSQVFILGTALYKKDKSIVPYSILLSSIGAVIAFYQTLLQFGFVTAGPCSATSTISCAEKYFSYYGYITIPVMALTGFVLLIAIMLGMKRTNND